MSQNLVDWLLLLGRWAHITTAVTWIGTSIFFMWLDRTFRSDPEGKQPGHLGTLWMVHGGGFYHVQKLQMGPTKVPDSLHWFKWESYWTWITGIFLLAMIFYSGSGIFLIDEAVAGISFPQALAISLFSIFGSWFVYDFLWERKFTKNKPIVGHTLTILWIAGMSYFLCHQLSGRAAYLHLGAMMGTWMTANVFLRIIPRQTKMVEAAKQGLPLNPDWPKNAKNRSTHNTYLTLPVILVMLSNHFPLTYGHSYNWLILLALCGAGAAIREFFVVRLSRPGRARAFAAVGVALIVVTMVETSSVTSSTSLSGPPGSPPSPIGQPASRSEQVSTISATEGITLSGVVRVDGPFPPRQKLALPPDCGATNETFSEEVVAERGFLKNVIVRITKGHENLPRPAAPASPVEIDQRSCIYFPHVAVARAGQDVVYINSDSTFHNVRSFSTQNPAFNDPMPLKGQRLVKRFQAPEFSVQTKCSLHPWMNAYLAVIDHPYFSITDTLGRFDIKGLKPGSYTVETWHEYFGTQVQEVMISTEVKPKVEFVLKK